VKGYPIGTFIFWKTREELRTIRNIGGLTLPAPPEGDFVNYVLDGQQRLTSLFTILKGLTIQRDDHADDYSECYIDLGATHDEAIVITDRSGKKDHQVIRLADLMYGKLKMLTSYPEPLQDIIQSYKDHINAYPFSAVVVREVPIEVATEIFTRLNVSGKALSVFEIMVAKTFDSRREFDLAERFDVLINDLAAVDYETIPAAVVLQTLSILLVKECRKKDILNLPRKDIIDIWPAAVDAIKRSVDYFRDHFRIPVSRLLPYPSLIVPFSYFFHQHPDKPKGDMQKRLADFLWRASLGGRYSYSVESRLAQDIKKIDQILAGALPQYDWAVDVSAEFIRKNGWFSVGRSFIKTLLCLLAYHEPKSFSDNAIVRISNDWLKQANSKNYHHFFPRAYLRKQGVDDIQANHVGNITIVDDYLNKREIRAKPPSTYMKQFALHNPDLAACMRTHLIRLDDFGVFDNDYDRFLSERCRMFSRELKKRIIVQDIDTLERAVAAEETEEAEAA
jgi:hypothetical protein